MGFNIYKEIPKIKDELKKMRWERDIPIETFACVMMMHFGMKRETVSKWLRYFMANKIIEIDEGVINFK